MHSIDQNAFWARLPDEIFDQLNDYVRLAPIFPPALLKIIFMITIAGVNLDTLQKPKRFKKSGLLDIQRNFLCQTKKHGNLLFKNPFTFIFFKILKYKQKMCILIFFAYSRIRFFVCFG